MPIKPSIDQDEKLFSEKIQHFATGNVLPASTYLIFAIPTQRCTLTIERKYKKEEKKISQVLCSSSFQATLLQVCTTETNNSYWLPHF